MKMKPLFTRLLPLLLLVLAGSAAARNDLRIAAVVNDEVISVYSLNARLALVLASSPQRNQPDAQRRLAPQVLRSLIDDKLKLQEARRLNITVLKDEVDEALARMEERNGLPKGGLDEFLARSGIYKPVLIEQVEADLAWYKAVNRRLRGTIQIGDDEIDQVIAEIKANKGKPEYAVSEIFLPIDDPTHEADVRLLADRLVQELKAGVNFGALARNFSQSASAAVGGDMGWIRPGQLAPELDAELAKMRSGTVAGPIKTSGAYYILLMRGRRSGPGLESDDVTVSLQQIFLPFRPNASEAEVTSAMREAGSLGQLAHNCADMAKLAKQSTSPLSGSLGHVKLSKVPAQLRTVVHNLPLEHVSEPIRLQDGVIILMVCERQENKTSEADIREKIRRELTNDRLNIAARRYLRDLRRAAFVDIRI